MDTLQINRTIENLFRSQSPRVLIALTGAIAYQNELYEILADFSQVSFCVLYSPAAQALDELKIWDNLGPCVDEVDRIDRLVGKLDCVVLPSLTRNSLAKIAGGISDSSVLYAVQIALLKRIPVVGVDACWNPRSEYCAIQGNDQNEAYNEKLNCLKSEAVALGMKSVSASCLSRVLSEILDLAKDGHKANTQFDTEQKMKSDNESKYYNNKLDDNKNSDTQTLGEHAKNFDFEAHVSPRVIVTYDDIVGAAELKVPKDAYLTDLAREYAEEHSIPIHSI